MAALGVPVLINQNRSYWLSSIGTEVIHSTIVTDTIDANVGNFSTVNADIINASTLNVSTLSARNFDVSGMLVSSIQGNDATFSTLRLISGDLSGDPFLTFTTDPSGIRVDGCPIIFNDLVYLTSTINIIQVSTLVDTDIFAANGFYSTLSSGSLSSGVASILQANISSLYVSSLEGFDISGADPKEWSLYPTLNSSIIFQPGNVLSNDGNKLYYNGFDLTDTSGGGVDWSLYKAKSTVDMSSNRLINLSTILFQDGASLTSLTGNNLQYNGQPIQYGNASNVRQWASYPAVSSVNMSNFNLSNAALFSGSNLALTGSNVTNGNTFTGTLSVAGTTLIPLASINNLGQLSCQDINVGSPGIGLADVNIYGATALPGDNALYVEGGVTCDGGTIHGFSAGVIPVAGINTGRIDMLQAGFNILHPLVGAITTGAALGITAGGAISMAAGGYLEVNTSTIQCINTSQGNKNTTIQAGFLTIDPDIGATSSIKLFNTLGGGVEIDGGGQGSLVGFSTLIGGNVSTVNLNVSTINGVPLSSIQVPENIVCSTITSQSSITTTLFNNYSQVSTIFWGFGLGVSTTIGALRANNILIADNITGVTNAPMPLESRIENFSSIQSGTISTIDLVCSTINGLPPGGGGGGSNFTLATVSTLQGGYVPGIQGSTINIDTNLQFIGQGSGGPGSGHSISSLREINSFGENLLVQASSLSLSYTGGPNPNGAIRLGSGGAFDAFIGGPSTIFSTVITSVNELYASTIRASGGLPVKFESGIQFASPRYIDFVEAINLSPDAIPDLQIGGSTITLIGSNVKVNSSLSTNQLSTGKAWIGDMSGVRTSFSTILNTNPSGPGGLSSLVNVAMLYDSSNFPFYQGLTIENYINGVDNLDIALSGNGDGGNIYAYTDNRSTLQNLIITANNVGFTVPSSITVTQSNVGNPTVIDQFFISTPYINGLSSINNFNPTPAYTNLIQYSTMDLYVGSTTLLCFSTATTSSNINNTDYDTVVGLNGVYKFGVSLQLLAAGAGNEIEFFFLKNDNVIPSAGGIVTVNNNDEYLTYCEIVEPCNNGDKIQVGCFTNNAGVSLSTVNGNVLLSPAAILTAYKVG